MRCQLVAGGEFAASGGSEAEHAEVTRGDAECSQHDGLARPGELRIGPYDSGHAIEGSVARAEIAEIVGIQWELRKIIAIEKDADDSIGLGVRERPQEHTLNHAENCAIRTNRQRQRKHDDHRESGCPAEGANRVPKIVANSLELIGAAHVPAFLLNLSDSSEAASRGSQRFRRRHPIRHVLLDLLIEVESQFLVEFLFHVAFTQKRTQP